MNELRFHSHLCFHGVYVNVCVYICIYPGKIIYITLILYISSVIDTNKQVHNSQIARIAEYKTTPTCFDYCPRPSSGIIHT